ncbi:MAG TPA: hypothetical protein VFQ38_11790 [Longimicrobiales bacterium]|nr:hypothetical protein [Longimicrobiales bacterium]
MFLTLLAVTFAIAAVVSLLVARAFREPIRQILARLVSSELSAAWQRYITFAIFVVGLSGGVRIYELQQYINPRGPNEPPISLDRDRWVLEVYRTIIETLKSIAWMLLVFFLVALVAYVILRGLELRAGRQREATPAPPAP